MHTRPPQIHPMSVMARGCGKSTPKSKEFITSSSSDDEDIDALVQFIEGNIDTPDKKL